MRAEVLCVGQRTVQRHDGVAKGLLPERRLISVAISGWVEAASLRRNPIGAVAPGIRSTLLGALGKVRCRGSVPDAATTEAVLTVEPEVFATSAEELSVVTTAGSLIGGHGIAEVASLLATGASSGASERMGADESLGRDKGVFCVASVEALLRARLVISTLAGGHSRAGRHAGFKGGTTVDLQVGSSMALLARHEIVLSFRGVSIRLQKV
jgi:hypothetical protein